MKRFSPREFLFLCAPILLVGAGFVAVRLLHPPRDPDAVIALNVTRDPNPPDLSTPLEPELSFGWDAAAKGGPQDEIQLLYSQKLVAQGDNRSQILFQEPASPTAPNVAGVSVNSGGGGAGPAFQSKSQNMDIPYQALPIWTKRVECRGDFVAVPLAPGAKNNLGVGIPSTFATLARIKGAARVGKTFPVRFDAEKLAPLQALELETLSPTNALYGADTCVTTQLRSVQRRIFARLVAFDGKTKRQLWSNLREYDEKYRITAQTGGSSYLYRDSQFFKLRDVPAQWSELIYIVDAAFNPNSKSTSTDDKPVNAAEIERLKKAGWLVYSKRLTVRKAGAKITAPNYSATPNTQYVGTQTSVSKTDWVIKVRLLYNGPTLKPDEQLDSPYGPEFFEAGGKSALVNVRTSYNIQQGSKPKEYLATINVPLKALGQPRPLTMKMKIADAHAMPLDFQTKLQVPKIPH